MLIRLRGPDGMIRLTVEPTTTFGDLGQQVGYRQTSGLGRACEQKEAEVLTQSCFQLLTHLPPTIDPKTIVLSNSPTGRDAKRLGDIVQFQIGQIGLKYAIASSFAFKTEALEARLTY